MSETGDVVATRHHAGGWWITVWQFEPGIYAWTLEGDERAARLASSIEEARASADAWMKGLDHDCVALGCGDWI